MDIARAVLAANPRRGIATVARAIVMPDGTTIYPGRNGQYSWGQYAYYSPYANGYQYDYNRTGRYDITGRHDNGHHYGWRNGRGHGHGHGHGHHGDGGDRD